VAFSPVQTCSWRDRVQHYLLNWIMIFRYQMVHHGFSRNTTLKYLGSLESVLKKLNLII